MNPTSAYAEIAKVEPRAGFPVMAADSAFFMCDVSLDTFGDGGLLLL
ncbi:hypothetical protein NP603_09300 [Methylomonas sp. SURF-1]|uniref:Uncharacterized protein n=1 Tax=Methylomonas aurea TaxID=2952224 RepID=A0ABT1UGF8_9GAMM|nr:hypothetical protein [Methylomonas sp. SURF-1]MCQ8181305.1 hypothetical protein [Methylomonas sp. SURF-1]